MYGGAPHAVTSKCLLCDVILLDLPSRHRLFEQCEFHGSHASSGLSIQAPLVQLDRMSAYGADGRRFESCMGCFLVQLVLYVRQNVLLTGLEPAIFALGGRRLIH